MGTNDEASQRAVVEGDLARVSASARSGEAFPFPLRKGTWMETRSPILSRPRPMDGGGDFHKVIAGARGDLLLHSRLIQSCTPGRETRVSRGKPCRHGKVLYI